MIWPLQCSLLRAAFLLNTKLISKDSFIAPEILNIVIIALAAITLNELILLKEISNLENRITTIIKLIRLIVIIAFITESPLKFLVMIELTIYPLRYLIIKSSKDKDKIESLKFMVILNTLGSIPFIIYIRLYDNNFRTDFTTRLIFSNTAFTLIVILFLVKTPIFIFHL